MKTNYLSLSAKNNRKAWKYFESNGYASHEGMVLHHKDITLKETDFDRYIQWNPDDLIPMNKADHRKLHMAIQNRKGFNISKAHKKHISEGMIQARELKGKIYNIRLSKDEFSIIVVNEADAARFIGCTVQLVSQVLSPKTKNRRAKGWYIEIV